MSEGFYLLLDLTPDEFVERLSGHIHSSNQKAPIRGIETWISSSDDPQASMFHSTNIPFRD
jgi:hypothetical protein